MVINLYRYQLPLTMPLVIKGASVAMREGFYVEIDQHWGEIAPPLAADLNEVEQDLISAVARLRHGLPHNAQLPAVQFGLDCALAKISVAPLLTEQALTSLPLLEGARDPLLRAWRCRRVHPTRASLSLTGDLHYDASLVRELCMLAPQVRLVLDAGGRLQPEQILDLWSRLDGSRIDWILDASCDLTAAQALAEQAAIPLGFDLARGYGLAATTDFTSANVADMANLVMNKLSFARAIVLRPAQLGGLSLNQMLVTQARALGLAVMLGDSLQSGVGQAQLSHLSRQWLPDAPLDLGRCRYLLDSGINEQGQPLIHGLTPL